MTKQIEEDVTSVDKGLMSDHDDAESQKQLSKRNLRKCLYVCSFAFMMNYSAYAGLIFLQSSIHIEDGMGTTGLFVVYATSALSTICFVPLFIDFMGAKIAIVAGEIGILCYTLANFYPSWYTIIPAALLNGLTESASWAGSSVYVTYLGEQYWERSRCDNKIASKASKSKESYVYKFFCQFYIFVYFSQVIGNALVSVVLTSLKGYKLQYENNSFSNLTVPPNVNLVQKVAPFGSWSNTTSNTTLEEAAGVISDDTWEACGSIECQADFIYGADTKQLSKYAPNVMSVYLLLSLFGTIQVTFTLVHAAFLPRIPAKFDGPARTKKCKTAQAEIEKDELVKDSTDPNKTIKLRKAMVSELKETFRHMISPLHVLIFPMIFYYGAFLAFVVTEFTRAYISCAIGVEQIGIVMVAYGLTSMVVSGLCTKILPLFGRNRLMIFVVLLHLGTYLLCLYYTPTQSRSWMIYINGALFGACDGAFLNLTQGMFAIYFEDRLAIAFSVKNFATNMGIVAGTGWSTSLCVYVKIYLLIGMLVFSVFSYIFAELRFRSQAKRSLKQQYINGDQLTPT